MALTKKTAELPLIGGLDTKTDEKQVKLGKLLSAQNVSYKKPGKVMKREGFQSVGQNILDTTSNISDGQALMNFKNELLAFDKENIYSYVAATDNWKDKGNFVSAYITDQAVSNGTARDYCSDSAYYSGSTGGIECYVFMRNEAGVDTLYYQVNDGVTRQNIIGPVPVSATALNPKVIVWQNLFVIYYYDTASTTLRRGILPINNLGTTMSFSSITLASAGQDSVSTTAPAYAVATFSTTLTSDNVYVFFNNDSGSAAFTFYRYSDPTSLSPINTRYLTNALFNMKMGQIIYDEYQDAGGDGGPIFAFIPANDAAAVTLFLIKLTPNLATTIISAGTYAVGASANYRCTLASLSTATNRNIIAFADYLKASRQYMSAWSFPISWSPTSLFQQQQLAIAGDAFIYDNKAYVFAIGGADIINSQSTYFILNTTPDVVGRFAAGLGAGPNVDTTFSALFPTYWVPSTDILSSTEFQTSVRNITAFGEVSGVEQTGIVSTKIDFFEPERSYSRAEIANSLYVGGGMLFQYDGQSLVEDSFNWRPVISSATPGNPGSTLTYSYVAVWEWVDNAGNLHRSAPSDPVVVTTAAAIGSGGANNVSFQLLPLSLTYKTPANRRSPIVCVLYRTEANLTIFQKLPVTSANNNTITGLYITPAPDTTLDANLGQDIYTTGEAPNDIPPPIGDIVVYRNRLFALDSTNPLVIYFSKEVGPGIPVEWSDFQTLDIDPSGGDVIGLAAMDDKLLIFKENSIRYISGQGPNRNAANSDYGSNILITTDAGCVNNRSLVNTPEGVIFKSSKGVYFINRGLQVSYIGAPVERWNENFITSGVLMANNNQVRLSLDNNTFLVYDYFVDNWATFTGLSAVDSIIWNDNHAFIRDIGKVCVETPDTYQDDGVSYSMEVMTSWAAFGGIQGYQRLWNIQLLGEFKSPHNLLCEFYYNYNNSPFQTIEVTPVSPSFYGGPSPYGNEDVYGGQFNLYQYELRPEWEKCMSVKVKISDTLSGSAPLAEGYELSNLRFSYGVIGGSNRLKNAQVFG